MLLGLRMKFLCFALTILACTPTWVVAENRVSLDPIESGRDFQVTDALTETSWTIAERESYWPLVRQSAEHLAAVNKRIGTGDNLAVAFELERLVAWLKMTQVTGMTDVQSGVPECISLATEAASSLRNKETQWTDPQLRNLVVYGHLCVAKSHLNLSVEFDNHFIAPPRRLHETTRSPLARVLRQLEVEIESQRVERGLAQYRYDTVQSARHFQAALYYFGQAVDIGSLDVDSSAMKNVMVPEDLSKRETMAAFVTCQLRPGVERLAETVDAQTANFDRLLTAALR